MRTESASILKDVTEVSAEFVVQHVYWPTKDYRRYTSFYLCGNISSAKALVEALLRPVKEVSADEKTEMEYVERILRDWAKGILHDEESREDIRSRLERKNDLCCSLWDRKKKNERE